MSQEVDWLHSQAGVCKVDLYNPDEQKDQDRKVICFVDISSLNVKDKDSKAKKAASQSSSISEPSNELDLGNLEEKEVIVIKDNEKHDHSKTKGAVCLFKQGSTDELSVVSWLNDDLQKYANGLQHALTPSDAPQKHKDSNTFIDSSLSQKSDTSLKSAGAQKGRRDPDNISCYVNKLCSLVFQMARKEITDKLEGAASKCIHQEIHDSAVEGKSNNSRGSVNKTASQTVNECTAASTQKPQSKLPSPRPSQEKTTKKEDTPGSKRTSLFYGEMSNQSGCRQGEDSGDKQMCQQAKQSGQDDSGTSVSKGLMVYANQVASDMMFSFMKTMKVQRKDGKTLPACVVLKRVILKHTKDVISDLIDSTMKNLHNVTGVLMTDSDFASTVKKNLYNMGSQKSIEILEVMVRRLYNVLVAEQNDKGQSKSHSLAYTILKTAFPSDSKSQSMQFATLKTQKKDKEKAKPKMFTCAEKVSEHIIKEGLTMLHSKQTASKVPEKVRGSQEKKPEKVSTSIESLAKDLTVTALMLIQQHLIQQTNSGRDSIAHDSGTSSLGFVSRESHFEKAGKSQSSKSLAMTAGSRNFPQELNSQKGDISSILLSIIQKVLREAGFNIDDNSSETNKSFKQVATTDSESSKKALSTQPNSTIDQFDNMDQVNKKFIDQLVESVMNLCLFMTKCNNSDLAIGDLSDEQNASGASFSRNKSTAFDKEGSREASQVKSSGKQLSDLSSGSEVIVNNQNANSSTQNKELQAILQWMAASHFNVPNLSFMNEEEGNLKKLPLLAEKAAKKGCSVGDIIQEVMRYFEKQQIDAAVGNVSRYGLMDWLLANL
ncbi:A-kinase anchor protein 4-like [Malaclemys terrapin pileata]|uniref:A-kinase anchor protein 4-like n=1 Tax=Malaclemys terrapin pileata TaxID=2991368 RepID=UPI0023A8A8B6|nr:A-kinase anchor protein 4-like [Malaclemys terrapin pileata]